MGQDLLAFLRPLSPFKSKSERTNRPTTTRGSARTASISSYSTLGCGPPMVRRKLFPTSQSTQACSASQLEQTRSRTSFRQDQLRSNVHSRDLSINSTTDRETVRIVPPSRAPVPNHSCADVDAFDKLHIGPEPLNTRDSEIYHISHIRQISASRPKGHWTKVSKLNLTKRERQAFCDLRKSSTGPVRKVQVLTHCSWFPSNPRKDSGHRPFKLTDSRFPGAADERWEEDPFTGDVWSVRWVSSVSPTDVGVQTALDTDSGRGRRIKDRTIFGRPTNRMRGQSQSRPSTTDLLKMQAAEISTIRLVR